MSHHETPQKRERLQKLKLLHSPLTPPISTPPICLPLWQQPPKRNLILLRWRGRIRGKVETVLEGRTEKPEAAASLVSSPRPDQAGEEEPGGGGGGAVLIPVPEVGACGLGAWKLWVGGDR
jgi:hypothetical protein